jgi:hypothetical protein
MRILLIGFFILPLAPVPVTAQDSEATAVLRVSRDFLRTLIGVRFEKDEPIDENSDNVFITGAAHAEGKFDVKLLKNDEQNDFDLSLSGTVTTRVLATRRPVQVRAHGAAPFHAQRRIHFDGKTFTAQPICLTVAHHFQLDRIDTLRHGPFSPLVRGIARPAVRRGLLDGDRQTDARLREVLTKAAEEESDKLVDVLNNIDPVFTQIKALLKGKLNLDLSALQTFRATTDDYLQVGVGKEKTFPKLPDLDAKHQAPLELWISSKVEAQDPRMQAVLKQCREVKDWQVLRQRVLDQLVRRHSARIQEIAKKAQAALDIDLVAVPNTEWRVLTFAPRLRELPLLKLE